MSKLGGSNIINKFCPAGSGGGSVGRAVASDTRDLQLESQHWQTFIYQLYIEIEKTKIKKKRPGMAQLLKIRLCNLNVKLDTSRYGYLVNPVCSSWSTGRGFEV